MDNHICSICQKEVTENAHFWREHRIKEAAYFQKYHPRYSKETGELIEFKTREFYLNNDFNGKQEMATWFKKNPEEAKDYALNFLKKRKEKKDLIYAPSQVELRSLIAPSMVWFKKNFENYGDLCENLGFKKKFDKEDDLIRYGPIKENAILITDSREQNPLLFKDIKTEIQGLPYADYTLKPNRLKIYIERKSLPDFAGTLGLGYDRFYREIQRAKKDGAYLIVLVESPMNDALHFNYLPQMKFTKTNPEFVFHNVRKLIQDFNNLQFLFCKGRIEAGELLLKILTMTRHPKHIDLQFYYDTKKL